MYLRHRLKRLANGDTQAISTRLPVLVGIGLLFAQIPLGGWVSTNYAGWACPGVPVAQAAVRFNTISRGFNLLPEIGPNYEGGQLEHGARAAIQVVHRAGAFVVLGYWLYCWRFISNVAC